MKRMRTTRLFHTVCLLSILSAFALACSSQTTSSWTSPGDAGVEAAADASPSAVDDPNCEAQVGPSQTVSQRCCLSYGIDGCGANLFCAAFDGRTVATCYIGGSRKSLETCVEPTNCASGKCVAGQCQSAAQDVCKPAIGCANPDLVCAKVDDDHGNGSPVFAFRCESPFSTSLGAVQICRVCKNDAGCEKGLACLDGRCKGAAGTALDTGVPMDYRQPELCCSSGTWAKNEQYSYSCR